MIKGITGVPGSGKSYFAVHLITSKFYKWNPDILEWELKDKKKPVTIFSNVAGLKLPHYSLDQYFQQKGITYETFFTVDYMEKVIEKYGQILILLDEAQKFFPSEYKNKDVLFFFQYHRHLGVDIILTFQTWFSLSRRITDLMEFEIRAVRRSFSIVGEFRYHYYFGNDRHGGTKLIPDRKIFSLYRSFEAAPGEKPPSPVRKILVLLLLAITVFFVGWKFFIGSYAPATQPQRSVQADPAVISPPVIKQQGGRDPVRGDAPTPLLEQPHTEKHYSMTRVQLGGFWYGNSLVAVDFFGHLVKLSDLQYAYEDDFKNKRVFVMVPDSILAQIKTALPGENGQNDFYQAADGTFARIGGNRSSSERVVRDDLSTTGYRVIHQ
jgi:hypothetical protein